MNSSIFRATLLVTLCIIGSHIYAAGPCDNIANAQQKQQCLKNEQQRAQQQAQQQAQQKAQAQQDAQRQAQQKAQAEQEAQRQAQQKAQAQQQAQQLQQQQFQQQQAARAASDKAAADKAAAVNAAASPAPTPVPAPKPLSGLMPAAQQALDNAKNSPILKKLPSPTVTRIDPTSGAPGITLAIYGNELNPAGAMVGTKVIFNTRPAISPQAARVVSNNQLSVTVPPGNGSIPIYVETAGGKSSVFTFTYLAPVIAQRQQQQRGVPLISCGSKWYERYGLQALEIEQAVRGGYSFDVACQRHDSCYDDCKTPKAACDNKLRADAERTCGTAKKGHEQDCAADAWIFFDAVSAKGDAAFRQARARCKTS